MTLKAETKTIVDELNDLLQAIETIKTQFAECVAAPGGDELGEFAAGVCDGLGRVEAIIRTKLNLYGGRADGG